MSGVSELNVSRVDSIIMGINPHFGMHEGKLSSEDCSSSSTSSTYSSDDESDRRYLLSYKFYQNFIF
jgi:hypothetical protein